MECLGCIIYNLVITYPVSHSADKLFLSLCADTLTKYLLFRDVTRVKLRIKTDCQQFEMKEDANEEANEEVNQIKLEPVVSPAIKNQSPHLAPEKEEEADAHLVRILRSVTEHPVLLPFSE